MSDSLSESARTLVTEIVSLLSSGKYEELLRRAYLSRLNVSDIEQVISEYGVTLLAPQEPLAEGDVNAVLVESVSTLEHSVRVDLWSKEEGRSDLSLELTLRETDGDRFEFEIDDLHVL